MKRLTRAKELVLVIGLALGLLLTNAPASAQGYIRDTLMHGSGRVAGFLKAYDSFYAETTVYLEGGGAVTPSQVRFGARNTPADSCSSTPEGYKCTLTLPEESYLPSATRIPVRLYNGAGQLAAEEEYLLVVDGEGPSLTISLPSNILSGLSPLRINYSLTDKAFPGSDICSGIGGVEFSIIGFSNTSVSHNTRECLARGSAQLSLDPSKQSAELCGMGFDMLGQNGAWQCVKLELDSAPPQILANSFRFELGGNVSYLGPGRAYPATAYVNIKDKHLNPSSVRGEFSGANANRTNYVVGASHCSPADIDVFECVFEGVEVVLGEVPQVQVVVYASDSAGNNATATLVHSFPLDNKGPEPLAIRVNKKTEEPLWVGSKIQIIEVDFSEPWSGMAPQTAFLDLRGLGLQANVPASACGRLNQSAVWRCQWTGLTIGRTANDSALIIVSQNTTDVLGNRLVGSLSKRVIIDRNPPELLSFNLTQEGAPFTMPDGLFLEWYPIVMRARLREDKPQLTVRVIPEILKLGGATNFSSRRGFNASSVNTSADIREACTKSGEEWICEYRLEHPLPGYYNASFIFEDAAMNSIAHSEQLTIVEIRATKTEYWKLKGIERMPSAVDRSTAPYLTHQLLFLVTLERVGLAQSRGSAPPGASSSVARANARGANVSLPATQVKLLKVILGNCTGDWQFVQSVSLLDGSDLSEFPYLETLLQKKEMPMRNLTMNCELQLYSLISSGRDSWVNEQPQRIKPVLIVPFYDTELPKSVLARKIQAAKDSPWIRLTDNVAFQGAVQLLQYAELLVNIDRAALQLARGAAAAALLCEFIPGAQGICAGLNAFANGVMEFHEKFAAKFIGFLTCDYTGWDLLLGEDNKISKFIKSIPMALGGKLMEGFGYTETELTNPRQSLFASTAMLCVPGIVDNMRQMRDVECAYAYCMQEASKLGVPDVYCEEIRSYGQCVFWGEEAMWLFPVQHLYNDAAAAVNSALESPLHLVVVAGGTFCELGGKNLPVIGELCKLALIGDMLSGVQGAFDIFLNLGRYSSPPVDYCAMLENG